jgi:hypothetical protein
VGTIMRGLYYRKGVVVNKILLGYNGGYVFFIVG